MIWRFLNRKILLTGFMATLMLLCGNIGFAGKYSMNNSDTLNGNVIDSINIINKKLSGFSDKSNTLEQVNLLCNKSNIYFRKQKFEEALLTANQALIISKEIGQERFIEKVTNLICRIYLAQELYYDALDYLYSGYSLAQQIKDSTKLSWYMVTLSNAEMQLGRFTESMEINLRAIEYFAQVKDSANLAIVLRDQGVIHSELGNFSIADGYLSHAKELFSNFTDSLYLGLIYQDMAALALKQSDLFTSEKYVDKSIKILSGVNFKMLLRSRRIKAEILLHKRDVKTAIKLLTDVLEKQRRVNDPIGQTSTLFTLGNAYFIEGDLTESKKFYNKCLRLASENSLVFYTRGAYRSLARIYGMERSTAEAYKSLLNYVNITDSLYNIQKIIDANRMENQLLLRQKENEIHSQRELLLVKNAKLKQESIKRNLLLVISVLLFGVIVFAYREYRVKRNANKLLLSQKGETEQQKNLLEQRTRDLTDSLNYAKRIQKAVLSVSQQPQDFFHDSFLIFIPKELVSGDFYWFKQVDENRLMFAVADCTGHGVPGAFMSIIGMFGLNQIVSEDGKTNPGDIINSLNTLFNASFEQREGAEIFDGMDIGLCNYNRSTRELLFGGANIYLHILRRSNLPPASSATLHASQEFSLYQVKCDRQSVGYEAEKADFTTHSVQLMEGDIIYLFTDGFTDQFGGAKNKKYKLSDFRQLLCDNAHLPINKQRDILFDVYTNWKGGNIQVDDVTVLGVRIP